MRPSARTTAGSAIKIANMTTSPSSVIRPIASVMPSFFKPVRASFTWYARLSDTISERAELRALITAPTRLPAIWKPSTLWFSFAIRWSWPAMNSRTCAGRTESRPLRWRSISVGSTASP